MNVSVVIPALNEAASLESVIARIRECLSTCTNRYEVVVVVDGATDDTEAIALRHADKVLVHPKTCGYGRSLKTGITAAAHDCIVITDADGTYPIEHVPSMLAMAERYDMVVGARQGRFYAGGWIKRIGRVVFRWLCEYATGQRIPDINSGLRVFRRSQILPFFPLINSGFSFTTTCTLSYLLNDLLVGYVPIEYHRRHGVSKVHHLRDSLRALQIILEAILRCNPIKAFLLLVFPFALLSLVLAIVAIAKASAVLGLSSLIAAATASMLLGLGFLAVSLLPRPPRPVSRMTFGAHRADSDHPSSAATQAPG
ncbi:MAG: glycosyltransferase family 2 protein [Pirellula sp.]